MGRTGLGGRLAWAAALGACTATAHTWLNLRCLRIPPLDPDRVVEPVSILLPARDEAHRVGPCLQSLLAQESLAEHEILVLDDRSSDGTAEVVRAVAGTDPRVRLIVGDAPRPGWLGKADACDQLSGQARGHVLVFVDADVVLAPTAVARAVAVLREADLQLVSPYPRQDARTGAERLVQPLLQWSWLTFLPLRLAERSSRPSLTAANGQLFACDAAAYRLAGGHAAVRDQVLEDVALARTFKRARLAVGMADGTTLATCRMYGSACELREGYAKSLWAAFGGPTGAVLVCTTLAVLYLLPPLAAVVGRGSTRWAGLTGTLAAVAGRAMVARRVGGRVWPDSCAHPASVLALVALTGYSHRRHRLGTLTWKGRSL